MTKKYRIGLIPIIFAFVLPFIVRMAYVNVPLERDEGAYAYGAWRILEGEVLYKDIVDFSPPGIFYLYAAAIKIFGKGIDDIRFFTCVYMEIALIWMFFLMWRMFSLREAWITTAILGFIASEPTVLGFTSNKETFLLLPIIASAHLLLKGVDENKKVLIIAAGLISGLGFFIKQQMVFFSAGLAVFTIIYQWQKKDKGLIPVTLFASGATLAALVTGLFFLMKGAFKPFYYWVFKYPFEFAHAPIDKTVMLSYLWQRIFTIVSSDVFFWAAGLYAVYILIKKKTWQGWFIICLGVATVLAISAGFRFRQHYFILLTPVIAMSAGLGISELVNRIRSLNKKKLQYALLCGLGIIIIGVPLYANRASLFTDSSDEISRKLYGTNPFVEAPHIAQYIAEHTEHNESIFVFGSEPEIYFYAQRKNPTKHLFIYPLTARYGSSSDFQRDAVSAVKEAEPFYIIWIDIQTSLYASAPSPDRYVFEEIEKLISDTYVLDGYVLIGRKTSYYGLGVNQIAPSHRDEKIPIYLYKIRHPH